MNKRILVAMDDSDSSEFIFEHAIRLAQEHKSNLKLLHVLSSQDQGLSSQKTLSDLLQPNQIISNAKYRPNSHLTESGLEKKMLERLVGCVEKAKSLRLAANYVFMTGKPEQKICETALAWHADLIVLGGKEQAMDDLSPERSVRNFVIHHAPCSIEVVRLAKDFQSSTLLVNELLLSHLSGWQ